jgi:hypothetical protein
VSPQAAVASTKAAHTTREEMRDMNISQIEQRSTRVVAAPQISIGRQWSSNDSIAAAARQFRRPSP